MSTEASVPTPPLPATPAKQGATYTWGTGRRKKSVARVRVKSGTGKIMVNDRPMEEYFRGVRDQAAVRQPLVVANLLTNYDVWARVNGGGPTGQADSVKLGLARALLILSPESSPALRDAGLLTRDARMKERKKYGQKGARKRFQFSKR